MLNLNDATLEDAHNIARSLVRETPWVAFSKQDLTMQQEVDFCSMIGECQQVLGERSKHIAIHDNILRVTGELDQDGEPGLFGHEDALDWHANQASNPERSPLIWLYAKKDTYGSVTSWINMIEAYDDLPSITKREIEDIQITLGYKSGNYSNSKFFVEHHNVENPFRLVHTNDGGQKGLYFPFLQIFGMVDKDANEFGQYMEFLTDHVLKDKYRYDHEWNDGDVVISEQWLSIHKRHTFKYMQDRVLHRIAFDYDRVKL